MLHKQGALAAVQQITQPLPPASYTTSGSISLMDSDEASVNGAEGGSSSTMAKKKQVGNIEPVSRSVTNNTQGPRMTLCSQVSSQSPTWSYHSNWIDLEMSSPNIPYRGLRPLGFGRDRGRGVFCPVNSSPVPGLGRGFG